MTPHLPVLFLDVDGVLNTRPGFLDGEKLEHVRRIVRETCCHICLSSSWRLYPHQFERIRLELKMQAHSSARLNPMKCPHCGHKINIGSLMGSQRSKAKSAAAKANGAKGGRPRKTPKAKTPSGPANA